MNSNEIYNLLKSFFPDAVIDYKDDKPVEPYIIVSAKEIDKICLFLRDEENLQFDYLSCLSSVDFDNDNLAAVYNLYSFVHNHKLNIKVIVPKSDPVIKTVSSVWNTANWHEREAYDLMGIIFDEHPDFRRILLPDDWEGYPLRKDYKVQEFYNGMKVPY
ncbi:MAG: NADH-quinone oxidoreductase subunit C [Ignavibacteria bacterium]|nr:NADH-quinone oxidoreductase subunit C [Ignavibacteria bacterium]